MDIIKPSAPPHGEIPEEGWKLARNRMLKYLMALGITPDESEEFILEAIGGIDEGVNPVSESMQRLRGILKDRKIIDRFDDTCRVSDFLPPAAAPGWNRSAMIPQKLDTPWNGEITRAFTRFPIKGLAPFIVLIGILIYIFFMF